VGVDSCEDVGVADVGAVEDAGVVASPGVTEVASEVRNGDAKSWSLMSLGTNSTTTVTITPSTATTVPIAANFSAIPRELCAILQPANAMTASTATKRMTISVARPTGSPTPRNHTPKSQNHEPL